MIMKLYLRSPIEHSVNLRVKLPLSQQQVCRLKLSLECGDYYVEGWNTDTGIDIADYNISELNEIATRLNQLEICNPKEYKHVLEQIEAGNDIYNILR